MLPKQGQMNLWRVAHAQGPVMAPQGPAQGSSLHSQISLMLTGVLLAHAGLSQFFCFPGPLFFLSRFLLSPALRGYPV